MRRDRTISVRIKAPIAPVISQSWIGVFSPLFGCWAAVINLVGDGEGVLPVTEGDGEGVCVGRTGDLDGVGVGFGVEVAFGVVFVAGAGALT